MARFCENCRKSFEEVNADAMDIDDESSGSSHSSTITHPSSVIQTEHYEELEQFWTEANNALEGAFPVHRRSRNSKIGVLLLRFEEDDLGVVTEIERLERVFVDAYGFETKRYDIPSTYAESQLSRAIYAFRDQYCGDAYEAGGQLPLLIVYYGGHSSKPAPGENSCRWSSKASSPCAQLNWTIVQAVLFDAPADVLVLLDCCYASSAVWRAGVSTIGAKETIAACGPGSKASGVGERSFTSALISELQFQAHEPTVLTAVGLHGYLLLGYRLTFQPFYASSHRTTRHSTTLIPCSPRNNRSLRNRQIRIVSSVRVLLAVHLKRNPTQELIDFLTGVSSTPTYVSGMSIEKIDKTIRSEAVFTSGSTMALISVPVPVWNLLPDYEACQFVGMIRSSNYMLTDIKLEPKARVSDNDPTPLPRMGSPDQYTVSELVGVDESQRTLRPLPIVARSNNPYHFSMTKSPPPQQLPELASIFTFWQCHLCMDSARMYSVNKKCNSCGHEVCDMCKKDDSIPMPLGAPTTVQRDPPIESPRVPTILHTQFSGRVTDGELLAAILMSARGPIKVDTDKVATLCGISSRTVKNRLVRLKQDNHLDITTTSTATGASLTKKQRISDSDDMT